MNSRRNDKSHERDRIAIPDRGDQRQPLSSKTEPPQFPHPQPPKTEPPKDLASQREAFGFDDIPVDEEDMEHVRFRDIFRAWGKQAIQHSPLEKKLREARGRRKRLNELKNDLKWAMQADLDEPVAPRRRTHNPQSQQSIQPHSTAVPHNITAQPVDDAHKTIDININLNSLPKLPKIKKPSLPVVPQLITKARPFLLNKKAFALYGIAAISIVGFLGVSSFFGDDNSSKTAGAPNAGGNADAPTYKTLVPDDKNISELGGWKRVSPPESNPVFAYADKIDDVLINVSQQPLPENFKDDKKGKVKELAKSFSATQEISVDGNTLYLGASSKGPQSAIMLKDDTLILIKSQAKINDDKWREYAKSLR